MSHEEFVRNQREMYYDRKQDASLQAVAEAAAAGETGRMELAWVEILAVRLRWVDDLGGDELGGPEEMPPAI